jgi:DNA-binding XRE family transcriptional regulator
MTQREAARGLGVCRGTYRAWETYGRPPRIQFWPGIISFLGYDPHPAPTSTAERLMAARRVLGLTQRTLAERLGVTQGAIQNWECGTGLKRQECRRAVAGFLDSVR